MSRNLLSIGAVNTVIIFILLLLFPLSASAQFQFFEQMFQQQGGGGGGGQHQEQVKQNVPSDSTWYRQNHDNAGCDKYLCPGTLSCVHFPHHCPCAFPALEQKFELGWGSAVCLPKGGWSPDQTARKVELARKGLL